jgi:hypothetical protein
MVLRMVTSRRIPTMAATMRTKTTTGELSMMSLSYSEARGSDAGWFRRGSGELGLIVARVFEMQE